MAGTMMHPSALNLGIKREPTFTQAKSMRFQPFQGTRQTLGDIPVNTNRDGSQQVSDGLIKKIRKSSVSGKPKEQKKIPLVSNHRQVAFKPTGLKRIKSEKNLKVPVPEQAAHYDHDPEMSPMDIDAPLVRVRNLMKKVPRDVPDIDAVNDPLKCSLYAQEICDYLQVSLYQVSLFGNGLMNKVLRDVPDIDAVNDPLKCSLMPRKSVMAVESRFAYPRHYLHNQKEVIPHMRTGLIDWIIQAVESRFAYPRHYLHNQKEVTPHMRTVLIDWIIQVQVHQELNANTLHLCVAVIDRFLVGTIVPMSKLQLMGVTALLVAAKYFERFPPEIPDLCHLTDGTYTPQQILKMERELLNRLNFDLNIPCPMIFLDRFLMVKPCDKTLMIKSMAMYFLDLSLIDVTFVYFTSSLKAAAAIYISRELIGCDVLWDKAFSHYTKYSENDLQECVRAMRKLMAMAKKSPHTGAHTKYSHATFHGVSNHRSLMHISLHPKTLWPHDQDKNNPTLEMII